MAFAELSPNETGRDPEKDVRAAAAQQPSSDQPTPAMAGSDYEDDAEPSDELLMAYARAAVRMSNSSDLGNRRATMARSWRAFNNQHDPRSRYAPSNTEYRDRSRLFIPKVRMAVNKTAVSFASALFSTNDVVNIEPENPNDDRQRASAAILKADLNIRLDRTSHRSGIPWFWIAVASCIDCQVAGAACSKVYWEYEYLMDTYQPKPTDTNVVGMDGQPVQTFQKKRVLRDRFVIEPHATENVIVDMAAPFYDVVQGGAFFIIKIPMHIGDIKTMTKPGRQHMGGGEWMSVSDSALKQAADDYTAASVRSARDRGRDRYASTSNPQINDLQIVWVHENFIRCHGRDYQFWSLGTRQLLSLPVETIDAYPFARGNRPYVLGVGSIEPHNVLPMSPVEAIRPLSDEMNELRNLAVDSQRQNISPIAKVKRGSKVDLKQLRRRGPTSTILMENPDDVVFEPMKDNTGAIMGHLVQLSVEMDELSGSFSTSGVQNNRNLNETVGGMKLLAGSAGGKTEFDLRVMIETWAEPVLRLATWAIQYYETDERLLTIAGEKAKLFQRFNIQPNEDRFGLLDEEVSIKISAGLGSADPMQRLQKLQAALEGLEKLSASGIYKGQVTGKAEPMFNEFFGLAGWQSAEPYFDFKTPEEAGQQMPPSPEALAAEKQKADIGNQQAQTDLKHQQLQIEQQRADREAATYQNDVALRRAAQNKSLIDEATGEATNMMTPHEARQPLPVESALTQLAQQMAAFMAAMAHNQEQRDAQLAAFLGQQGQQIGVLVQQGLNTQSMLQDLVRYQRAPKEIVRDANGRPVGVRVGGEAQPVNRDAQGNVAGMG